MSEEKKIFDPKFARIFWNDELEGKECIFADSSQSLVERVNTHGSMGIAFKPSSDDGCIDLCPFGAIICGHKEVFTFCYYDPLYEVKWAWKNGKQIQAMDPMASAKWVDVKEPMWCVGQEYRIKPKKWRPFNDIAELKSTFLNLPSSVIVPSIVPANTEPMIWVRDKERPDITRLITDFNAGSRSVALAGQWHILEGLFEDYEFLDGTPCGVEE